MLEYLFQQSGPYLADHRRVKDNRAKCKSRPPLRIRATGGITYTQCWVFHLQDRMTMFVAKFFLLCFHAYASSSRSVHIVMPQKFLSLWRDPSGPLAITEMSPRRSHSVDRRLVCLLYSACTDSH